MQPHQALSYLQLRLFLYYTGDRILYDQAGRGRAFREIATGQGPYAEYYRKGEWSREQEN
jgi:hypothetical protein